MCLFRGDELVPQALAALAGPGRHHRGDFEPPGARHSSGALPKAEALEGQGLHVKRGGT